MNQHNRLPRAEHKKSPTAPRFSFANRELLRQDLVVGNNLPKRVIIYPSPNQTRLKIRNSLADKGLLLGETEGPVNSQEHYAIPVSARPISYDASIESDSDYVYGDDELFFDLGKLLGQVASEGEKPLVLDEEVGKNIALVEFTRVNEPKILLVPGFELSLRTANNANHALNLYSKRLYDEFGQKFDHHGHSFIDGFHSVLE